MGERGWGLVSWGLVCVVLGWSTCSSVCDSPADECRRICRAVDAIYVTAERWSPETLGEGTCTCSTDEHQLRRFTLGGREIER